MHRHAEEHGILGALRVSSGADISSHRLAHTGNEMPSPLWRSNPLIYEINAWTWLHDLRAATHDALTLADVPDEILVMRSPPGASTPSG